MKKKLLISTLILSLCVLLAGLVLAVFPARSPSEEREVANLVTAYLEEAAAARYLCQASDLVQDTVASVPAAQRDELARRLEAYPGFRSAQMDLLYPETRFHTDQLAPFLENLSLFRDCVAYYAFLNQLEETAYKSFSPSYQLKGFVRENNLAILDLYESLNFQYSDSDEPSFVMTRYQISLVKHGGKWLILAVESDDLFYQTYREADFDLQSEIAGVAGAVGRE